MPGRERLFSRSRGKLVIDTCVEPTVVGLSARRSKAARREVDSAVKRCAARAQDYSIPQETLRSSSLPDESSLAIRPDR